MANKPGSTVGEYLNVLGKMIENISSAWCVLCLISLLIVSLLGIFFRYILNDPFEWTEEASRFLFLGCCYIAINIAQRRQGHIAIKIAVDNLPKIVKSIVGYLVDLLITGFIVVLIWQGYLMVIKTTMVGYSLDFISMKWIYLLIPIGMLLTLIQLWIQIINKIISDLKPKPQLQTD